MAKSPGMAWAFVALGIYLFGGIATFAGLACLGFVRGQDLWGLGSGTSIGILLVCGGLSLTILGVLIMRICRNRGLR
ncbi:hypothetical protein LPW11_18345 [Geomonas sp. RF6]|uniref:hypothetical protein n=1 Tax=Geomonas sp. RF6 TaxID=2897342 RepID=UPI001E4E2CEC|nr:hypothetical protein [Geomonas sp. RF6]UFS69836.1 hypothetical protein LPW11_18345 [Geomonas sp. RF6]